MIFDKNGKPNQTEKDLLFTIAYYGKMLLGNYSQFLPYSKTKHYIENAYLDLDIYYPKWNPYKRKDDWKPKPDGLRVEENDRGKYD